MSTHVIESNNLFTTEITVRESDEYTKSVLVRFRRNYIPEKREGCDEMFLTVDQLESFGDFLLQQAAAIRNKQS